MSFPLKENAFLTKNAIKENKRNVLLVIIFVQLNHCFLSFIFQEKSPELCRTRIWRFKWYGLSENIRFIWRRLSWWKTFLGFIYRFCKNMESFRWASLLKKCKGMFKCQKQSSRGALWKGSSGLQKRDYGTGVFL